MSRPKRSTEPCPLMEHVRKQLVRIRKLRGSRQDEFAKALGIQRSAYTKKEIGDAPFSLADIDILTRHFGIGLAELFRGYPGFHYEEPEHRGLSEEARKKYPYLDQAVQLANVAKTEEDREFLWATLKYAIKKLGSGGSCTI